MNGRLIEGPLWAVKIALLQSLYLSCANIAEVMSPNTIHLHTDVCKDMGPSFHTITPDPNSFSVILFSNSEETQWTLNVRYGWDTKESYTQGTVGGLGLRGPETPKHHQLQTLPTYRTLFPFISIPFRIITHILIGWYIHRASMNGVLNVFPYL